MPTPPRQISSSTSLTKGLKAHEKGLRTFFYNEYFRSTERLKEIEIDEAAKDELDLYDEICASPDFHLDTWLEPGEMQFSSNHTIVHARAEYQDWPARERRRHLLRLWLSLGVLETKQSL